MLRLLFRSILFLYRVIVYVIAAKIWNRFTLAANGVKIGDHWTINGFISIECLPGSSIVISQGFRANSGSFFNNIGRQQKTSLICREGGRLSIGDNVGISASTIVCHERITIGSNVRFGGNCVVYDTDFHSLKAVERTAIPEVKTNIGKSEVIIGDNVFIGGHCTILKGSVIGDNSIIGAGAVVRGSKIPANQIWGGNPAVFIKEVRNE
ncbi:MAG: acyltransferase [Imperialibacter sp.]|uniref:acyltransferase n=1 Tax=Imperialibacter sp. TaxID=2038411 RepID=UPI003A8C667A